MYSHELQKLAQEINVLNHLSYTEFLSTLYARVPSNWKAGTLTTSLRRILGFRFQTFCGW